MTFTWNYRFVNTPSENDGKDWLALKEVVYSDEAGLTPTGFGEPCIGADNIDEVLWLTARWAEAANKPVLHEDTIYKAEEQEAMHKLISSTEPLPPLGEPHKEVWLVQAFEETICNMEPNTTPLFTYAFTDRNIAKKVREAGLAAKLPYVVWTLDRVVLDAPEDATRHIIEMVAINARENAYYDKEIL